ncbi:MAG TPA: DUF4838 domain-containing protein [Hanamia sp.]|nr:DUF4838 domain-containing protein [Hanamia sp.]
MKRRKFITLSSKSAIGLSRISLASSLPLVSTALSRAGNGTDSNLNKIRLNDIKTWDIVVSAGTIPSEKYAADEFKRLFKSITGNELKISTKADSKNAIYIGNGITNQFSIPQFETPSNGEESLHIHVGKDLIVITGAKPRGTLYGVYEFFERYLGVRFLTRDHTYIPSDASRISIPVVDFSYEPSFFFRWSYYQENFNDPAFATRLRVNTITNEERLGGKTSQELITHSISNFLPVSLYGKTHPEYFALVDGVRKLDVRGGGPQVCSTNADVIRIVTENVTKALDANTSLRSISVSQMDNNSVCECPVCRAFSKKEESQGAPHLALVNAVAKSVAVSHPGVKIGTLVYWYTRKPPKDMILLPNVQIMLCSIECCTFHPLDDPSCSRNKLFCEDFYKWKEICQNILIWNYNTNFSAYDLPFPNFNVIAKNVQLFQNNNAQGVFMQAAGNGLSTEMSDLRNYVIARCLWSPELESWDLVDEFCNLHYGSSAPPILAYLRFLHHNAEVRGVHPNCFPKPVEVGLDFGISQQIYSYFQKALELAPDEITRLRVEKATIPALRALLSTVPIIYEQGLYKFDNNAIEEKTFSQYESLVKKFSMERVAEGKLTSDYLEELYAIKIGIPAVVLENKTWRVLLLPEQGGRITGIFHKPTGSKLVNELMADEAGITRFKKNKVTWKHDGNIVIVTITSEDGSTWHRRISLPQEDSDEISIQAEYTAGVDQPEFEIHESPCKYRISGSKDPKVVSVFTKDQVCRQGNLDWQFDREITFQHRKGFMQAEKGCTSFAFYDHAKHYGIQQSFEAGTFLRFLLYWHPGRKQLGMEMGMPPKTLQKGQGLSFSYGISFLEKPLC